MNAVYIIILAISTSVIGYFWLYRIRRIADNYLEIICSVINCTPLRKHRLLPIYSKEEVKGHYKDREVIAGIQYAGIGFEWMPLPYIKIKLKEVIRYNYNKIPDFVYIQNGWLVFRISERLVWGVFDNNFARFFTKDFVVIALNRLLAVAEDAERGKTLEEIFK